MTALDKEIAFLKSLKYNAVKPRLAPPPSPPGTLDGCQCDFCRAARGEGPVPPVSQSPTATWEEEEDDDDGLLDEYDDDYEDEEDEDDEDDDELCDCDECVEAREEYEEGEEDI